MNQILKTLPLSLYRTAATSKQIFTSTSSSFWSRSLPDSFQKTEISCIRKIHVQSFLKNDSYFKSGETQKKFKIVSHKILEIPSNRYYCRKTKKKSSNLKCQIVGQNEEAICLKCEKPKKKLEEKKKKCEKSSQKGKSCYKTCSAGENNVKAKKEELKKSKSEGLTSCKEKPKSCSKKQSCKDVAKPQKKKKTCDVKTVSEKVCEEKKSCKTKISNKVPKKKESCDKKSNSKQVCDEEKSCKEKSESKTSNKVPKKKKESCDKRSNSKKVCDEEKSCRAKSESKTKISNKAPKKKKESCDKKSTSKKVCDEEKSCKEKSESKTKISNKVPQKKKESCVSKTKISKEEPKLQKEKEKRKVRKEVPKPQKKLENCKEQSKGDDRCKLEPPPKSEEFLRKPCAKFKFQCPPPQKKKKDKKKEAKKPKASPPKPPKSKPCRPCSSKNDKSKVPPRLDGKLPRPEEKKGIIRSIFAAIFAKKPKTGEVPKSLVPPSLPEDNKPKEMTMEECIEQKIRHAKSPPEVTEQKTEEKDEKPVECEEENEEEEEETENVCEDTKNSREEKEKCGQSLKDCVGKKSDRFDYEYGKSESSGGRKLRKPSKYDVWEPNLQAIKESSDLNNKEEIKKEDNKNSISKPEACEEQQEICEEDKKVEETQDVCEEQKKTVEKVCDQNNSEELNCEEEDCATDSELKVLKQCGEDEQIEEESESNCNSKKKLKISKPPEDCRENTDKEEENKMKQCANFCKDKFQKQNTTKAKLPPNGCDKEKVDGKNCEDKCNHEELNCEEADCANDSELKVLKQCSEDAKKIEAKNASNCNSKKKLKISKLPAKEDCVKNTDKKEENKLKQCGNFCKDKLQNRKLPPKDCDNEKGDGKKCEDKCDKNQKIVTKKKKNCSNKNIEQKEEQQSDCVTEKEKSSKKSKHCEEIEEEISEENVCEEDSGLSKMDQCRKACKENMCEVLKQKPPKWEPTPEKCEETCEENEILEPTCEEENKKEKNNLKCEQESVNKKKGRKCGNEENNCEVLLKEEICNDSQNSKSKLELAKSGKELKKNCRKEEIGKDRGDCGGGKCKLQDFKCDQISEDCNQERKVRKKRNKNEECNNENRKSRNLSKNKPEKCEKNCESEARNKTKTRHNKEDCCEENNCTKRKLSNKKKCESRQNCVDDKYEEKVDCVRENKTKKKSKNDCESSGDKLKYFKEIEQCSSSFPARLEKEKSGESLMNCECEETKSRNHKSESCEEKTNNCKKQKLTNEEKCESKQNCVDDEYEEKVDCVREKKTKKKSKNDCESSGDNLKYFKEIEQCASSFPACLEKEESVESMMNCESEETKCRNNESCEEKTNNCTKNEEKCESKQNYVNDEETNDCVREKKTKKKSKNCNGDNLKYFKEIQQCSSSFPPKIFGLEKEESGESLMTKCLKECASMKRRMPPTEPPECERFCQKDQNECEKTKKKSNGCDEDNLKFLQEIEEKSECKEEKDCEQFIILKETKNSRRCRNEKKRGLRKK